MLVKPLKQSSFEKLEASRRSQTLQEFVHANYFPDLRQLLLDCFCERRSHIAGVLRCYGLNQGNPAILLCYRVVQDPPGDNMHRTCGEVDCASALILDLEISAQHVEKLIFILMAMPG